MGLEILGQLFKAFCHMSLFKRLFVPLSFVCVYSIVVDYYAQNMPFNKALLETNSALFVGVILSVLLVFRTNSAYERWWEARRLWGQLINEIRNAACKVDKLLELDLRERERFGILMVEFAYSLKDHLRGITAESGAPSAVRKPMAVVHDVYAQVGRWWHSGKINEKAVEILDPHIRALADILGSCERISTSPITLAHKSMLVHMLIIYAAVLPWALAPSLGYFAIPVILIGVYMVLGLEVVADGKEHPFGTGDEDLPLDRLCKTVETSVFELLELSRPIEVVISPDDVAQWVVPDRDNIDDCMAIQTHYADDRPDGKADDADKASMYDDPLADLKP
jgi:putative membrane protein